MEATPQMGFVEAVKKVLLENYCNFNGRARRSEYWWWTLATALLALVILIPTMIISVSMAVNGGNQEAMEIVLRISSGLSNLVSLAILLPSIGVTVRRLHDIGKSGWYYLISLFPCVGGIIQLIWECEDSHRGMNEYGDSPKYPSNISYSDDAIDNGIYKVD